MLDPLQNELVIAVQSLIKVIKVINW
jgi:hypothetical protein